MFRAYLKYQLRSRAFLAPSIFVFFTVYHFIIPGFDMSRIGIVFLQALFYDAIRRSSVNLYLLRTSGFALRRLLLMQNTSYFIWFNLWFLLSQLIIIIWGHEPLFNAMRSILRFEILLLSATIIGNVISNSDFVTIKSKFWQFTAAAFVFLMSYLVISTFVRILWKMTHSFTLLIIIIIGLTIAWWLELQSEKKVKFFKYMLN
jgi:hypothetical protein